MKPERIVELRTLARKHEKTHRSAKIILELCDELEKTNRLYSMAIDAAFGGFKGKAAAGKKLRALVNM